MGATLLFWVGIAYVVYFPAGWPNYHVWGPVTLHAPWAGAVQKAKADAAWNKAQWAQCRANEATLRSAIDAQNASLAALAASGSRARAEADNAVQRNRGAAQKASEAKAAISAPLPAADTVCQRAQEVDRRLLEVLK